MKNFIKAIAWALALFHLYTGFYGSLDVLLQRPIHIGLAFVLLFALNPARKKKAGAGSRPSWLDILIILVSTAAVANIIIKNDAIMSTPFFDMTTLDLILGVAFTLIVLEAARRMTGIIVPILAVITIIYSTSYVGPLLPGTWAHRGASFVELVRELYMSASGLWGSITGISATIIASFLIFGAFMSVTGGGDTLIKIAAKLIGRSVGGPPKMACIASGLFGLVSGSVAANVLMAGVYTIPLMKRTGYSSDYAGAVESTASTGGQIMPPVMGAGAFIMAQLLGESYFTVAIAAFIPAILYYTGFFGQIHFEAKRKGMAAIPSELIVPIKQLLPVLLVFIVPLVTLCAFLVIGYGVMLSATMGTISAIIVYLLSVARLRSMREFKNALLNLRNGLEFGGMAIVGIAAIVICAQIIVISLDRTGIAPKLTAMILQLAGENMFGALVLSMVTLIILGMGMPTTAAYVIGAAILAPALISIGLPPLVAHMFIFYYAIISAITPPVCPAVFFSIGISNGSMLKTAIIAMRLAIAGWLVPFLFVLDPSPLLIGSPLVILYGSARMFIGVLFIGSGLSGYFIKTINIFERALLVVGGVFLSLPYYWTIIAGVILLVGSFIMQLLLHRTPLIRQA